MRSGLPVCRQIVGRGLGSVAIWRKSGGKATEAVFRKADLPPVKPLFHASSDKCRLPPLAEKRVL